MMIILSNYNMKSSIQSFHIYNAQNRKEFKNDQSKNGSGRTAIYKTKTTFPN